MDERIDPVVFRLGTKEYRLVLPGPAIRLFEEKVGKGLFEALPSIPANWTYTISLLWAAAITLSPHLTFQKLEENATPAYTAQIAEALGQCVLRAYRRNEEQERKAGESGPLDS